MVFTPRIPVHIFITISNWRENNYETFTCYSNTCGNVSANRCLPLSKLQSLTYQELWEQSDRAAAAIQKRISGEKKSPILVYYHMEPHMIVSFLGSVKAGHPYIPVDLSIPSERIAKIIESSGAELLIHAAGLSIDAVGKSRFRQFLRKNCWKTKAALSAKINGLKNTRRFILFTLPEAQEIRKACRFPLRTFKASQTGFVQTFQSAEEKYF